MVRGRSVWATAGILFALAVSTKTAWALSGQWEYNDTKNQWYYWNEKGERLTGRKELGGVLQRHRVHGQKILLPLQPRKKQ